MARSHQAVADAVIERHGRTFAEELGIDVAKGTPSPLFRLLCAATLMSARIDHRNALQAADALAKAGWRTAERMAGSSWKERVKVLNEHGYARYDERTARQLGELVDHLLEAYGGDLRRLREQAERDPGRERELLQEFKGIGPVGADIFLREAQPAWEELVPYVDDRVLATAQELGLPADAERLLELVGPARFPRLVAGLVRTQLEHDLDGVRGAAG